ncbi:carbohydrate-binding family 9-like protein [bacterium DOLJORAL78_65_58]|nr:MAG: carbohydrate-binding family 9-like protein [bacterium DOLJORAL78_65_58]
MVYAVTPCSAHDAANVNLVGLLLLLLPLPAHAFDTPADMGPPRVYLCARAAQAPVIDGVLDDAAWRDVAWTEPFTDIEGARRPAPAFATTAAMRWDEQYFYFAFRLEEPHLQASCRQRDSYIYQLDNDIEIFMDPDGSNHLYAELELNALNTAWDLLLIRPYRDGGPAVHAWDIAGLRTAVHLDGTLNDPSDQDRGWTVEVAMPWDVLGQMAGRAAPPADGDIWRVNFSRVQWDFLPDPAGGYTKARDPETGRPLPEHNWVWSPQSLIAMHMPENWGEVMFVTEDQPHDRTAPFRASKEHRAIALSRQLMRVYYAQRQRHETHGAYTADLTALELTYPELAYPQLAYPELEMSNLQLVAGTDFFRATLPTPVGVLTVDEQGRLTRTPLRKD